MINSNCLRLRIRPVYIVVLLAFLLDTNFLMLIPLPGILLQVNSFVNKYLIACLAIVLTIYLYKYAHRVLKHNKTASFFAIMLIFSLLFESLVSMIIYNETFFDVFTSWHHYLVILLAFPLMYIVETYGIDALIKPILLLSIAYCFLCIIQEIVYLKSGAIILKGLTEYDYSFRNAHIRLRGSNFHMFAYIILCAKFSSAKQKEKRLMYGLGIAVELFTQIFAYITRSWQVIYVAVLAVIFILSKRKAKSMRVIILITLICVALQFFDISSFLESFSTNSVMGTGLSTSNRLEAISYFWGVFMKSPLYGNGFIRDARVDLFRTLHGSKGTYAYSDVGIIGLLGETGIIGVLLYLGFVCVIYKRYTFIRKHNSFSEYELGLISGLLFFLLFTTPTLIVTNPENIIDIPIIVALSFGIRGRKRVVASEIS